jgi:L-alanine-DL-glutamate epimerase-like enolase superfamily enzyme
MSWVVTRINTDQGLTGVGASFWPPDDRVREYLVGKDPFHTEQHIRVLRHGASGAQSATGNWAVDLALWDLIGQACGQPLYKLWGGFQDRVLAYASLVEAGTPDGRADDALRLLGEGFRAIKLRLHEHTLTEDIALVEAVRQAVGDRMAIMVDANQTFTFAWPRGGPVWSYERALATAQELEQLDVVWLEEPLARYDFEHLSRLCGAVSIYIAGGEGNKGLHEFRWLVDQNVYDVIQPEAIYSEGISQLRKVAAMAEVAHKWLVPHNGISGVGMAGHLHLCASVPNCPYIEYMYDPAGCTPEIWQALLSEPLRIDAEGYVHVPQRPGLGIELNEDLIGAHTTARL